MNKNKTILLKKYLGSDNEELAAKVLFEGGNIKIEGDKEITNLLELGIEDPNNKIKLVYPSDGEIFLDALLKFFDSPYLYASIA